MSLLRSAQWLVLVALVFVAATLALPSRSVVAAAAITVDSNLDTNTSDNVLTLREAILLANGGTTGDGMQTGLGRALDAGEADNVSGSPGNLSADTITFDAGVAIIALGGKLPLITEGSETIDGSTTSEVIQGAEARTFSCINVSSADNTIKGLTITDCLRAIELTAITSDNNTIGPGNTMFDNGNGINASTFATGNTIIGNKIGTNAGGTAVPIEGGNIAAVVMFGSDNTIGGAAPGDGNIISGNGTGVSISATAAGATGNEVYGNFIGTDVTGMFDLGNAGNGIELLGASSNTIGGALEGQRNIISGNDVSNVLLTSEADNNTVEGNLIGPNIAGGGNLTNGDGIDVTFGASGNIIGPGNVISDNFDGIFLVNTGTSGNQIKGNLIGTDPAGTVALPNSLRGVLISGSAAQNIIGGTNPGEGNVIAFNTSDGVRVDGSLTEGNAIRGNSIHDNGGLGINNINGGNVNLAPPVISAVGSASGTACANCFVEVFSDDSDEGRVYHGSTVADGAGNWTYFGPVSGPNVTATATHADGNTSEFSSAAPCGDSDSDTVSDCDDADDDNDGFDDDVEAGISACKNGVNDDATDIETFAPVNDGCPAIGITEVNCGGDLDNDLDGYPNDGCPKDGSYSEADFRIGTGSQDPCGNDGWPADLQANNKLDIGDVNSFLFPLRGDGSFAKFGHPVPDPDDATIARWNLQINGEIDIGDVNAVNPAVTAPTARPPMFGGEPAFFTDVGNGVGGCPLPP